MESQCLLTSMNIYIKVNFYIFVHHYFSVYYFLNALVSCLSAREPDLMKSNKKKKEKKVKRIDKNKNKK